MNASPTIRSSFPGYAEQVETLRSQVPQPEEVIRRTRSAPGLRISSPELLNWESSRVAEILTSMDSWLSLGGYEKYLRTPKTDVLDLLLEQGNVRLIVEHVLGLDPDRLDVHLQYLFYLFAIERTGLLRVTDDHGQYTTDSVALLELEVMLDELPHAIEALRVSRDYDAVKEDLSYLLAFVGMIKDGPNAHDDDELEVQLEAFGL